MTCSKTFIRKVRIKDLQFAWYSLYRDFSEIKYICITFKKSVLAPQLGNVFLNNIMDKYLLLHIKLK